MKTLSLQAQYAYQAVYGIKDVENRTWKTDYRGKLFIHASGNSAPYPDASFLPKILAERYVELSTKQYKDFDDERLLHFAYLCQDCLAFLKIEPKDTLKLDDRAFKALLRKRAAKYGFPIRAQAIIGEVELTDIIKNSSSPFAEEGQYHWIFKNPVFFGPQIYGVKGKLRLWEYDLQTEPKRVIV